MTSLRHYCGGVLLSLETAIKHALHLLICYRLETTVILEVPTTTLNAAAATPLISRLCDGSAGQNK